MGLKQALSEALEAVQTTSMQRDCSVYASIMESQRGRHCSVHVFVNEAQFTSVGRYPLTDNADELFNELLDKIAFDPIALGM